MNTKWKIITEYPNYGVSNRGEVRNLTTGLKLKSGIFDKYGHRLVVLSKNRKKYTVTVHRLVLTAFVGKCPDRMECRHLDGNGSNNNLPNLKWGTKKDNSADSIKHGTRPRGEAHGRAKLTNKNILDIRRLGATMPKHEIAKRFGVHQSNIYDILNRQTWTHI